MEGSTTDLDPAPYPYLGCTFLTLIGSTLSLAPFPSMSLTLDHVGVTFESWSSSRSIFGLQLFYLNLGSTPSLAPVPSMSHLRSCWGVNPGCRSSSIFGLYFLPEFSLYWYYVNPMLSSKFNILSKNSVQHGQIWIIPSQAGFIFPDDHFEHQQSYVIFKIECFVQ